MLFGRLDAAARLAAPVLIGNEQRLFVHHRGLDARPRAHIDAHLFAQETAEDEGRGGQHRHRRIGNRRRLRSEEHTSELQSLMRISYAVFCLKKKTNILSTTIGNNTTTT